MKIEIWSDIMCPFCYIGKRRLESALADFEYADHVQVQWKSFLLNPDMVTDPSKSTLEYLSETKGWSMAQTKQVSQQVVDMAAAEGLVYHMDKTVVANAKNAHRLLQLAKTLGKGGEMKERLLKAYFTEGTNIDDKATLTALAMEVGLAESRVVECLDSGEFAEKVEQDIYESRLIGVRGVPFFVVDRKYGISGAQPKEVFDETIHKAWEDYVKANPVLQVAESQDGNNCDLEGNCN
ncbi:DsbA family oxidoreductase [Aquiflexum gelatinilyticum]|uniref:DsbA family oxidoreductase n=1 Tax=Aquiflexum gelatinilyticum TaxID=2961943 RepID=A0A9X2P5U2_9BACT|nr:DsbA family oxidoreductase [Aquiflexum gelatinilyticum]MCR9014833.1 DsbA family oxidoreductase [Aquiflexum gelatinilyticum]